MPPASSLTSLPMYYPSPSPSNASLPSSSTSSSSTAASSTTSSSRYSSASYYTSSSSSSSRGSTASKTAPYSSSPNACWTPRAPTKDCLPLPAVAEYRSGMTTPTASPIPSRRTNAPLPAKFNPILINPSSSSHFDFLNPNAPTNHFSHDLAFASGHQTANYIPILCGSLNVLIYIQNPPSQLTCLDFLRLISAALGQPVDTYTDQEWLQVGSSNQQAIMKAYQKRVAKYPDPYIRKIDFLLNQTRFRGLHFTYNAWTLITA